MIRTALLLYLKTISRLTNLVLSYFRCRDVAKVYCYVPLHQGFLTKSTYTPWEYKARGWQPVYIFLSEFDFASANKGTKKFSASPGMHEYKKRSRTTALDDQGCSGSVSVEPFLS